MKAPLTLATGLLLLVSAAAHAEVYRHVDAQGNVTFSDEPMQGGEEIQVKPVTTVTLPKPEAVMQTDRLLEEVEREGAAYESVALVYPENDQAFHSGNGDVTFQVRSTPGLRRGHRYEVTLDGQPVGQSTSSSITVNNIDRGTHSAGVHIVDNEGIQVKSGQPVTFTLHRPSRLN
ncbi:DUF4124 domain-containing protein [Marinobacter sp.]|uniref:DUF4124 domain-containing protein n=1 Tax=Marinobacter sp. TaxID=50741 RepID=UPI001A00F5BF|nr:DUF4124 domain-containing protein [Marinobacter sp.]MBE0485628.1 DUF4124 domain-containing protein [Marinobacter sp.]